MSVLRQISYQDGPNIDAFSRLRVSEALSLFSVQSQYNNSPIQIEAYTSGTGMTPATWNSNTRMDALIATAGTGVNLFQSYRYFPYQPGRSHLIVMTGVIGASVSGAQVDHGYFDANNGIMYRQTTTGGLAMVLRTSTSGSVVETVVAQSSWNIDNMQGAGGTANPSGLTLNPLNDHILVIDLQFLGMGRVRTGFDINGIIYYVHQFQAANIISVPYMQSATLPVAMQITTTSTATTKTAYWKCASVITEGTQDTNNTYVYSTPSVLVTAGSGVRTPLISIQPATTYQGIPNRQEYLIQSINLIVTGSNPVYWELICGANFTGSGGSAPTYPTGFYNAGNIAPSSGLNYGTGGTLTTTAGGTSNITGLVGASAGTNGVIGSNAAGAILASGYASGAGGGNNPATSTTISPVVLWKYPLTLDHLGNNRTMGTITLCVTGLGGSSTVYGSIGYTEQR